MGVELVEKKDWSALMGTSSVDYHWKYTSISSDREGWEKVLLVIKAVDEVSGRLSIYVRGPYSNEKEYGDIGAKLLDNAGKLSEMAEELVKDENYSGDISAYIGDGCVKLGFQIVAVGGYIDFFVEGPEDAAKFVSTVIKKALDE